MEPQKVYEPAAVANFFIEKSLDTGRDLTPMKLLKLVYIAHGWSLGLFGRKLIDEPVQAWQYGPVIPSLYHELKEYGAEQVTKLITEFNWGTFSSKPVTVPETDTLTRKLLDNVWGAYGNMSGLNLSAITHKPGTPWSMTSPNSTISSELIEDHYKQLAKSPARNG